MKINKILLSTLVLITALTNHLSAQLNPLINQYYQNRYLANPAMAGIDKGGALDLAYRNMWSGLDGAPKMQALTVNYGWDRVGVGFNANFDQAGLQKQIKIIGTYAYHLPLNAYGDQLHFGLSAGFMNQRIDFNDISGNQNDSQIGKYNNRKTYFDGDFGLGFNSGGFNAELSLVNLKNYFNKDNFDLLSQQKLYATAGYLFKLDGYQLHPKLAYRVIQYNRDLIDAGVQLGLAQNQLQLTAMYHSNDAMSFGLGFDYKQKLFLQTSYTTQTGAISTYTNGSFEINLGFKW